MVQVEEAELGHVAGGEMHLGAADVRSFRGAVPAFYLHAGRCKQVMFGELSGIHPADPCQKGRQHMRSPGVVDESLAELSVDRQLEEKTQVIAAPQPGGEEQLILVPDPSGGMGEEIPDLHLSPCAIGLDSQVSPTN